MQGVLTRTMKSCEVCFSCEDGTEIDEDFFLALEDGDTLELHTADATEKLVSSTMQTFEVFIRQCLSLEPNIRDQLQAIVASGKMSDFHEFIASRPIVPAETKLSLRSEHPHWFEGVVSQQRCKEGVLRGSAECRMRSYLQHVQKELRHFVESQDEQEEEGSLVSRVEQAIAHFKLCLKERKFNASYFDRSYPSACCRLCDSDGRFVCGGEYSQSHCHAQHTINPYSARHNRIIFSTWNLDHMIEKSRSVIPALKQVLSTHQIADVNLDYFFDLLFTKYDPQFCNGKRCASFETDQLDGRIKRYKLNDCFPSINTCAEMTSLDRNSTCLASDTACTFASQPSAIFENISTDVPLQNECIRDHVAMNSLACSDEVEGNSPRVNACKVKQESINSRRTLEITNSINTGPKPVKAKTSPSKKSTRPSGSAQSQPSCSYVTSKTILGQSPRASRLKLDVAHKPTDHDRAWPGEHKGSPSLSVFPEDFAPFMRVLVELLRCLLESKFQGNAVANPT
ncbi:Apoptosis DNA fragmentation factor 40kDa [Trinorchestia longiramus]|nr:Apoptosis DNA fragmentation factor 40kDa [Trinorchestia longiramus]